MKKILSKTLFIVICISVAIFWYKFDESTNRGYTFGYYGDFNRTKAYLSSIENVKITDEWYNPDIFLEEFGFVVMYNGNQVRLFFSEGDKVRNMSKSNAMIELKRRIQVGDS